MRVNLLGRPHYYETIGPLIARVVLTVNGDEFFWRVEVVTGAGIVRLDRGDGVSKLWPLLEVEGAKEAARDLAASLRKRKAA